MGTLKVWDGTTWQTVSQQGPAGPTQGIHAPTHYAGGTDPLTGRLALNTDGAGSVVVGETAAPAGTASTAVGWHALASSTGASNTGAGYNSLGTLTSGYENAAIGRASGNQVTTGYRNVFVGYAANAFATSQGNGQEGPGAFNSVAVGYTATIYGQEGVAVGSGAFSYNYGNVAIGANAKAGTYPANGTSGWQSVAVGQATNASGLYSLALGSATTATRPGSVAIGRDSGGAAASATADNDFVLGTAAHNVRAPGNLYAAGIWNGTQSLTHTNWLAYTPIFASDVQLNGEGMTPGAGGYIWGAYAMVAPYTMALRFIFQWGSSGGNGGTGPIQWGLPPGYVSATNDQRLYGSIGHPNGGLYTSIGVVWAGSSRFFGTCFNAILDGQNGTHPRLNTAANYPGQWYPNGNCYLAGVIQVQQRW
jgi:Head domain of trimeric autotransporter adhesin